MSIIDIIFSIPEKLFELGAVLQEFLTYEITIPAILNITPTFTLSMWGLLGGAGIVTLIIIGFIRG